MLTVAYAECRDTIKIQQLLSSCGTAILALKGGLLSSKLYIDPMLGDGTLSCPVIEFDPNSLVW